MLLFILILSAALFIDVPTDRAADPTDNTYIPRPEWYFLFLFELLKHFKGSLEVVGAIVIPNIAILILLILPFIDRREERDPFKRPVASLAGIFILIGLAGLTWRAWVTTPAQSYIETGITKEMIEPGKRMLPIELAGKVIFKEKHCLKCHSINNVGGKIGPDLTLVGRRRDAEWMIKHFQDPTFIAPGLRMPSVELPESDLTALAAYLLRLTSATSVALEDRPLLEEGGKIFYDNNCIMCHTIDGAGGKIGPDLTRVGSRRDEKWLTDHFKNPQAVVPNSLMPSYASLGEQKLGTLSKFLMTYK